MSSSFRETGEASQSTSARGRSSAISTIGEDFYNSLAAGSGSYMSDDDTSHNPHDDMSHTSLDDPVPFLSPQESDVVGISQQQQHQHPQSRAPNYKPPMSGQDVLLQSERSTESKGSVKSQSQKRDISGISYGEDTLIFSERSTGITTHRDTSLGDDTLLMSERSNFGYKDQSYKSTGADSLMISENSGGPLPPTKDKLARSERSTNNEGSSKKYHSQKRDGSYGDDTLLMSERSNVNFRDHSTGCDSLLVSETTDESWRKMKAFAEDDDSSISSTPSTPFPLLETPTPGDAQDKQEQQHEMSQRIIQMVESPPLAQTDSDLLDAALMSAPSSTAEDGSSLQGQDIYSASDTRLSQSEFQDEASNYDSDNIHNNNGNKNTEPLQQTGVEVLLPPRRSSSNLNNSGTDAAEYHGSISTTNTLRERERGGRIPRSWIFDRIDGTVKLPNASSEGDSLPLWKRKPPLFLCLPSPLLGLFPKWLEESCCCVSVGRFGFFGDTWKEDGEIASKPPQQRSDPEQSYNPPITTSSSSNNNADNEASKPKRSMGFRRTLIMGHALLLNACALFATILSGVALTRSDARSLEAASFSKSTVIPVLTSSGAESNGQGDAVTLYLGLLALGIDNPSAGESMVVVGFRDFCDTPGTEQFLYPRNCNNCANVTVWIVLGFFLAMIAYLPTFAIGISRIYVNYDTNCSKVSVGVWSFMSLVGYILVLLCFNLSCQNSLYDGEVFYTSEGAIYNGEDSVSVGEEDGEANFLKADFVWTVGVGQMLFVIGFCLKMVDFTCNCCIATPAITRSRELQWDYEEGFAGLQGEALEPHGNPQEGPSTRTPR